MLLHRLIGELPCTTVRGDLEVQITGITHDSRVVRPGELFVALRGAQTDGNMYVAQAVERGAAAVASDREPDASLPVPTVQVSDARQFLAEASRVFFGDPASRMRLVGITGTNGKTTTAYLLHSVFRCAGLGSCLLGTLGMWIGSRHMPTRHTTPEAPELTSMLLEAAENGCTHGAMEVSSHALASKRVFGTRFSVGVFTNLTPDHLDFHGDLESYYLAKRTLFTEAGRNQPGHAVINADDPFGRRLIAEIPCPVSRFSILTETEFRLLECRKHGDGTYLRIGTPRGDIALQTRLIGTPNTYNVLCAVGAACQLGIGLDSIRDGIESVQGVPGRMELVRAGQSFAVVVDYAHTPDALEKLLQTLRELPHRRIITVFGCGGDRDRQKRPIMGEIAGRLSDQVIATSDNPRSEDPLAILAEIEPGLRRSGAEYRIEPDRRRAIALALRRAAGQDVVALAGKGHEDYQVIGSRVLPFDDRAVAREELARLSGTEGE
ncbi:MAG: UDP-N-acetylmuramoyl-L-alanyl-D-glutamate--2,6-diaminopimelate ligase [Acidobacteriota bacterium]